MKREYDFSHAVRGKFYRKRAELHLPIYLDTATRRRLERIAKRKNTPVADLVNQLLKKDLTSLESRRRLHARGAA